MIREAIVREDTLAEQMTQEGFFERCWLVDRGEYVADGIAGQPTLAGIGHVFCERGYGAPNQGSLGIVVQIFETRKFSIDRLEKEIEYCGQIVEARWHVSKTSLLDRLAEES